MAQSRLEKIGTIYSRVSSLLHGGAMKSVDKPIWYVIYEAFPPKYEPKFNREVPDIPIRKIYYEEDIIRAKFHKDMNNAIRTNLSTKALSISEKFVVRCTELQKEGLSPTEAYDRTLKEVKSLVQGKAQQKKN